MNAEAFNIRYRYAAGTDIGVRCSSNQDEVICCPDEGFFAVSDGMGGLFGGGETSKMITKILPIMIRKAAQELNKSPDPETAAKLLSDTVRGMSDNLYD
ncbi:MAG: hypothetical protein LBM69_08640, partial [Lachnospiraceae bacterium]|nr:hypothetical protein [Lachnospiraceae bacterium]